MSQSPKVIAIVLAGLALSACTIQGRAGYAAPPGAVEVSSVPVGYDRYPSTVYEGRTVYYDGHRWGYPHGNRWAYYRSEPQQLVRYRTTVRSAPPAQRREVDRREVDRREAERREAERREAERRHGRR